MIVASIGLLLAACGRTAEEEGPARFHEVGVAADSSRITRLVLLGTGTPNAETNRYGSAVAVVVHDTPYLVDAGAGVVHRANEAYRRGLEGLAPSRLATVFLTHLHTDHTVGLPDLMFTPWVLGREAPLNVFGPPGTESMIDHLVMAYHDDILGNT